MIYKFINVRNQFFNLYMVLDKLLDETVSVRNQHVHYVNR